MPLYTVIAEYRGGTYLGQARAASAKSALRTWSRRQDGSIPTGLVSGLKHFTNQGTPMTVLPKVDEPRADLMKRSSD
jgi:hypothetical protein